MARVASVYLARNHAKEFQLRVQLAHVRNRGEHLFDALDAVRLKLDGRQNTVCRVQRGRQTDAKSGSGVDQHHVKATVDQRLDVLLEGSGRICQAALLHVCQNSVRLDQAHQGAFGKLCERLTHCIAVLVEQLARQIAATEFLQRERSVSLRVKVNDRDT